MTVYPGTCYRHNKTGRLYYVVMLCTRESDGAELIVYKEAVTHKPWARPSAEWEEIVTLEDGRTVPRFERVFRRSTR